MSYLASWSGGKDCCLASWEASRQGYEVSHLFNTISRDYGRVRFHGTEARLIQMQAEALGLPLLQVSTGGESYTEDFKRALQPLPTGITGMVFGDMYNDQHLEWVQQICADLGVAAVEPLWGREPVEVLLAFLEAGFEATIVCVNGALIDQAWVGQPVDHRFREYLHHQGLDPCGENGEYHSLVVDGPLFQRGLQITKSRTVERDGYFMLDTEQYGWKA